VLFVFRVDPPHRAIVRHGDPDATCTSSDGSDPSGMGRLGQGDATCSPGLAHGETHDGRGVPVSDPNRITLDDKRAGVLADGVERFGSSVSTSIRETLLSPKFVIQRSP